MLITIEEVASYLKVSKETVYKMAQQNKIPATKVGNQWRFNRTTIDKWLQDQGNELSNSIQAQREFGLDKRETSNG